MKKQDLNYTTHKFARGAICKPENREHQCISFICILSDFWSILKFNSTLRQALHLRQVWEHLMVIKTYKKTEGYLRITVLLISYTVLLLSTQ